MRRNAWMLAIALGLLPVAASAQGRADSHTGFTGAAGLMSGSLHADCSDCDGTTNKHNIGLFGAFGANLNPNVVLRADVYIWEHSETHVDKNATSDLDYFGGAVLWYPRAHSQYFVKGGIGIASITTQITQQGLASDFKEIAPMVQVGIGNDFRLGKTYSITPFIDYLYGFSAKAKIDGASSESKMTSSMFVLGAAVTWH